jgi:aminoglycoside phosphotransferase (APT) family kinase protein
VVAPLRASLIAGGRSNLTYRVTDGATTWVVRRPPLGTIAPAAHDMGREHRVTTALHAAGVPVPRPLHFCDDVTVVGAPFSVVEHVDGTVIRGKHDARAITEDVARRSTDALLDGLVRLHAVDFRAVGLADFGRPDGYLERQVRRWAQQWERSRTGPLPAIEELARRLAAAVPASPAPTLVHGDYRLGNLALDPRDPGRVAAIFDWEMATLGDPLADLGYTLIYWTERSDAKSGSPFGASVTTEPGFATRAQLIDAYARATGRDVAAIDFYQVLALYKLAVISEGIYARFQMGKTLGPGFENMQRATGPLAERALAVADASSDARLRG